MNAKQVLFSFITHGEVPPYTVHTVTSLMGEKSAILKLVLS